MTPPVEHVLDYARTLARTLAARPGGLELTSVIVHGSIGFGDFVPGRSDLDLLIVGELPPDAVHAVAEAITAVPATRACAGLECSLVSHQDIADTRPLRPFRLHVNLHDATRRIVPGHGHPGDEDLTLHYAVARVCGITIQGVPADEIIPDQPHALVTRALLSELQWAAEKAEPHYAVLNAARASAYAHEGVLLSKLGGWLWARRHHSPTQLLDTALTSYLAPQATAAPWATLREDVQTYLDDVASTLRLSSRQDL